ncbi:MAG: hypothetical protein HQM10_27280, partial [Candidatus Riflebacteria bacterium]|nr:hypothetical protein [Candidatus Riflebacteria bacterium]
MKSFFAQWLAFFFFFPMLAVIANPTSRDINDLSWISGAWEMREGDKEVSEQWMVPSGGMMMGMGRTVQSRKTIEWEFLKIEQRENGELFFVASPSGQKVAAFKLVLSGKSEAVFENPKHDFPQRIIYRLQP